MTEAAAMFCRVLLMVLFGSIEGSGELHLGYDGTIVASRFFDFGD